MTNLYRNRTVFLLITVLTLCFMAIGCTHGAKVVNDPSTAQKEVVSAADDEPKKNGEDIEADIFFGEDEEDPSEDEGFFEEDNDDEFVIDDLKKEGRLVADPLYYFNISMYHFNDKLYFWCLKPAANAYKAVTPGFFREGLRNFSHFLSTPARFVSCLLQGKVKGAGTEIARLVINSTLGFCGVIDTAEKSFELKAMDEDLGQVLGAYSVGNGFYLYLPFLGPTTLRDAIGTAGEYFLDPVLYLENRDLALGYSGLTQLNSVSFMIGNYEAVKAASLDPYTMIRDFYIEQRNRKIRE